MGESDKKRQKEKIKLQKKQLKAQTKAVKSKSMGESELDQYNIDKAESSNMVKVAQAFRGLIYMVLAVSIVVAVILSNKGYIITFEDIFETLAVIRIGKVILFLFAASFFILGLKHLRAIR